MPDKLPPEYWPLTKDGEDAATDAMNDHTGAILTTVKGQHDQEIGYLVVLPGGSKIGPSGRAWQD